MTPVAVPRSDARARSVACLCAGVTCAELDAAIAEDPGATLQSLGDALGCGVQCGSCVPVLREALGEVAWFPATAACRPITRASDERGLERLIYRVDISLHGDHPYPVVLPGQHVVLRGETEQGSVERTYTVVAQDVAARRLTVAIRRKPDGVFTPWLLGTLDDGAPRRLEVSAPGGPGLRSQGTRSVVFFAGGVGITPAVAMLNALSASATMHLDYSVNDADDAAFLAKFEARSKDRPGFTFFLRETGRAGAIRQRDIAATQARYPNARFYLCGPEGFVHAVQRGLRRAGVEAARIHVELFALAGTRTRSLGTRFKAYAAGAMLAVLPMTLLLPSLQDLRPHGHPNVGHEQLQCVSCHAEAPGTLRQTLQAKVKHAIGWRQTGAVFGMQPVSSTTCVACHANPDDRHAPNRFLEPRFAQARAETGAQQCVSCHREHQAVRVTLANPGYCASCHQDLKVKDDRTSPTHDFLVQGKRWETCLQCHDYHGNHKWSAPLRLQDAPALEALDKYLQGGPGPYGATVVKARREEPRP